MFLDRKREEFMVRKKYQVSIIGAGNIAALFDDSNSTSVFTHAHAFSENDNFELKGFYDIDFSKAQYAAFRWGCTAYSNIEDALNNIDVVCCCVPDRYHAEILEAVSKYNVKLVVAEKPLTKTLLEAKKIQAIFNHRRIPLLLNYSRRYLPEFQNLKKDILNYGDFIKGTGYYGKGIQHNGSHMIDILNYLVGDIHEYEKPLHILQDFEEDDASCDVTLRIKNGFFHMTAINSNIVTIFELDLLFEKARVRILDGGKMIEIYRVKESQEYKGYYNYVLEEGRVVDYSNAMRGLVQNALGYLENNNKILCTLEDGLNVLNVCSQIRGEYK